MAGSVGISSKKIGLKRSGGLRGYTILRSGLTRAIELPGSGAREIRCMYKRNFRLLLTICICTRRRKYSPLLPPLPIFRSEVQAANRFSFDVTIGTDQPRIERIIFRGDRIHPAEKGGKSAGKGEYKIRKMR